MSIRKIEARLEEEMMAAFREAKRLKYNATGFFQMLSEKGALTTARILLSGEENRVSDGFKAMWELKRLDLTVEAICIQPQFRPLFTEQEMTTARKRLASAGYRLKDAASNDIRPAEIGGTPPQQRLRVFLCHSRADKASVRDLYHRLKGDGFAPWLDEENLIAGQSWRQEIPKAVRVSHVVIICLSRDSVKEGYLQKEIKVALDVADEKPDGTIFLIPTRLEDVQAPDRLKDLHWVNLFEPSGYQKLVRALNKRSIELGIQQLHVGIVDNNPHDPKAQPRQGPGLDPRPYRLQIPKSIQKMRWRLLLRKRKPMRWDIRAGYIRWP